MSQLESLVAKPANQWATGEEPMTSPQRWYLKSLCEQVGEPFAENLTKAAASKQIERLKHVVGRAVAKSTTQAA
jgi:hypothetical protein